MGKKLTSAEKIQAGLNTFKGKPATDYIQKPNKRLKKLFADKKKNEQVVAEFNYKNYVEQELATMDTDLRNLIVDLSDKARKGDELLIEAIQALRKEYNTKLAVYAGSLAAFTVLMFALSLGLK